MPWQDPLETIMDREPEPLPLIEALRRSLVAWRPQAGQEAESFELVAALTRLVLNEVTQLLEKEMLSSDPLVRCQVAELLGEMWCDSHDTYLLERLAHDDDWLVRRAAAVALAQRRVPSALAQIEARIHEGDADAEERVGLYYAAYRLSGEGKYFAKFIEGVHHEHYRVRCATCNLLPDVVDRWNHDLVVHLVETQLAQEDTVAAREALVDALRTLGAGSSPGR